MHPHKRSNLMGFVFLLLFYTPLFSSSPLLSLSDVLKQAANYSEDVEILKLSKESSIQEIKATKSSLWPSISSSLRGNYSSIPISTSSPLGSQFDSTGEGRWKYKEYGWDIQFSQPVFSFGRLAVLYRIAKKSNRIAELNYELEKEKFLFHTLETYVQLLRSQSQMKIASKSLNHLRTWEKMVVTRDNSGLESPVEVLQMRSRVQQAIADSIQMTFQTYIWENRLKILLNYPQDKRLDLQPVPFPSSSTQVNRYLTSLSSESTVKGKPRERKDLKVSELQQNNLRDWTRYERANYFPSISLTGNAGSTLYQFQGSSADFSSLVDVDAIQYSVGLQLNWNLFNGFATSSKIQQRKAEQIAAQKQWDKLKKNIALEQQESSQGLLFADQIWQSAFWALQASEASRKKVQEEFENGIAGLNLVLEVETEWLQASHGMIHAWIERILAQGRWKVAHGVSLEAFWKTPKDL